MNKYYWVVALRKLHTIYCFINHMLKRYVVEIIFSATALLLISYAIIKIIKEATHLS